MNLSFRYFKLALQFDLRWTAVIYNETFKYEYTITEFTSVSYTICIYLYGNNSQVGAWAGRLRGGGPQGC